jgi:hypothetical protein
MHEAYEARVGTLPASIHGRSNLELTAHELTEYKKTAATTILFLIHRIGTISISNLSSNRTPESLTITNIVKKPRIRCQ